MNCEHVCQNLSRYYDGEMNETESSELADHIGCCESCRCELASFQSLSAAVCSCQDACCEATGGMAPAWEQFAQRLSAENANAMIAAPGPATAAKTQSFSRLRWSRMLNYPAIGVGLAIAASLFLLAVAQINFSTNKTEIAVDLSGVIDRYAAEPAQALVQLTKQYAGKSVSSAELKKLLGYEPISAAELPDDVQLVSTSVLHLPVCSCQAGKCSCGPAGCNCAAMLCRRSDGTELLVLEHCDSEKVELSKQPVRLVSSSNQSMQLFGADTNLVASWVAKDHRLTAIGIRSEREALDLRN